MDPIAIPEDQDHEMKALRKEIEKYERVESKEYLEGRLKELKKKHGDLAASVEVPDPVNAKLSARGIKVTDTRKERTF